MIGCYVRVSGPEQNERGQRAEIQKWLKGNGLEARFYLDKQSGDNLDRPAFKRLQRDIFSGKIKTVVVWKLDRLSRSLIDGLNTLADWCNRGVRVVSVTQQLDFNGTMGHMLAAIFFALSANGAGNKAGTSGCRDRHCQGRGPVQGPHTRHPQGRRRPCGRTAKARVEGR